MNTTVKNQLHTAELAMLLALCCTLCMALWGQSRSAALSENLIRLHVIADSDSAEEQALKLQVRDAVLEQAEPLLAGLTDASQARAVLEEHLEDIRAAAESAAQGRAVEVTLTRESYPTRFYQGFALPAGSYVSLRVMLGSARGQNWWGLLDPELALSAAAMDNGEGLPLWDWTLEGLLAALFHLPLKAGDGDA